MDVSVIISTWNCSHRLKITLETFAKMRFSQPIDWELVLINNNCTDDTDDVVAPFKEILPLKYVHENKQGLSWAKNTGLKHAQGSLVIFTDDDVRVCSNWVELYWNAYQKHSQGHYFGGPVESEYENPELVDDDLLTVALSSVKGQTLGDEPRYLKKNEYFISANWACPRVLLDQVGGFDPEKGLNPDLKKVAVGEETDLMRRLNIANMKGYYLPDAHIYHYVPASKCSIKHIAERWEASGFADAEDERGGLSGALLFGRPKWMYRQILVSYCRWIGHRLRGQKGYRDYTTLRYTLGAVRGYPVGQVRG